MNVILLAPTPPPYGGIAVWTERMKKANLKNNWQVKVVDEKVIGNRSTYKFKFSNIFNEVKRHRKIWRNLKEELKNPKSQIVQACIPAANRSMMREIISAKITKKHNRKFIVHFRCTIPNMIQSKKSVKILKKLLKYTDYVFVLNEQSANYIKQYTNNYTIIPNFIEETALYQKKEYSKILKKVLYVGGVLENKGCGLIAETAKKFPNIEFRFVGKVGMDITNFPTNVILLGEQNKTFVKEELKNADVFMFLSKFTGEGFSNALAEAMASSLPCIVTDWAANKDMIENTGGIVLEDANVNNTAKAIKKIEDYNTREKMGKWNYDKVKKSYLDKNILDMYVDNYERLIKKGD